MKTLRKKFFYRIEHKKTKFGPYRHNTSVSYKIFDKTGWNVYSDYHKAPPYDGLDGALDLFASAARFGFASLRGVVKWWSNKKEVYALLEKSNFHLVRYEVTERFDSCRQSVANVIDMKNPKIMPFSVLTGE